MATEYRSKENWYEVVRRFDSGEVPAKEFCRREGLNYWTFCGWRRRFRDESSGEPLVEVGPIPAASGTRGVLVRVNLGGSTVELECAAEERQVAELLRAVRSVSC